MSIRSIGVNQYMRYLGAEMGVFGIKKKGCGDIMVPLEAICKGTFEAAAEN